MPEKIRPAHDLVPSTFLRPSRRLFLAEGTATLVATTALSSCLKSPLSLTSVSTNTPTALNPITVVVSGLDTTKSFSVGFFGSNGAIVPMTPIRTGTDGTVVVAAPLFIDGATGATSGWSTALFITQNGFSVSAPMTISDLPQLSDYGTSLGAISRGFYNYQQIKLGGLINAHQAIAKLPKATINNAPLVTTLQTRLSNIIRARNDIDRVVTNNSLSISAGTSTDGTPIYFNSTSVALMDRILGQYLLASSPSTTVNVAARDGDLKDNANSGAFAALVSEIQNLSGAISFSTNQNTLNSTTSTVFDKYFAAVGNVSTVYAVGGAIVAIAGTLAAAPAIATAGAALLLASGVLGVISSGAAAISDIANLNDPAWIAVHGTGEGYAQLGTDTAAALISGYGAVTGVNAGSALAGILEPTIKDGALAATSLLDSISAGVLQQQQLQDTDNQSQASLATLTPTSEFGQVAGTVDITNSEGPILSGLTGVELGNYGSGVNDFCSIADPSGDYSLSVPLDNSTITYSKMDLSAFDPLSGDVLESVDVNLSGLNPTNPVKGPTLDGTCNDTDADDPDNDDPDCDVTRIVGR